MYERTVIIPANPESETALPNCQCILQATSLDNLGQEVRRAVHGLGFAHFLYGLRHVPPEGEAAQFILCGYPPVWMQHYQAAGYVDIDPIVSHAYRSSLPLVWSEDMFDTPARQHFRDDARAHGLVYGISVRVGALPNEVALFSVANAEEANPKRLNNVTLIGQVYVLAAYIHEAVRRLLFQVGNAGIVAIPAFSARERECLRLWAQGHTAVKIAPLMEISVKGVHFHLQNIKRKLGVRAKHQAITRAILLGIV